MKARIQRVNRINAVKLDAVKTSTGQPNAARLNARHFNVKRLTKFLMAKVLLVSLAAACGPNNATHDRQQSRKLAVRKASQPANIVSPVKKTADELKALKKEMQNEIDTSNIQLKNASLLRAQSRDFTQSAKTDFAGCKEISTMASKNYKMLTYTNSTLEKRSEERSGVNLCFSMDNGSFFPGEKTDPKSLEIFNGLTNEKSQLGLQATYLLTMQYKTVELNKPQLFAQRQYLFDSKYKIIEENVVWSANKNMTSLTKYSVSAQDLSGNILTKTQYENYVKQTYISNNGAIPLATLTSRVDNTGIHFTEREYQKNLDSGFYFENSVLEYRNGRYKLNDGTLSLRPKLFETFLILATKNEKCESGLATTTTTSTTTPSPNKGALAKQVDLGSCQKKLNLKFL